MKRRILLTLPILFFFASATVHAGVFDTVLRRTAKVADHVPIRGADELAEKIVKSKAGREALESGSQRIVKSAGAAGDSAQALKKVLKADLQRIDPTLVRYADTLDKPTQQYLLVLGRGARECELALPDLAARARFLERGGAETVSAIGLYGDDIAKAAMRVDSALQGGKLVSPAGMRAVHLDDFGRLFTTHGDAAKTFWSTYVAPHWGKWLAGGALAWYLIDPEGFMDSAGAMTEEGFKRVGEAVGDAAAIVIRGASEGAANAMGNIAESAGDAAVKITWAILASFFCSWKGLAALASFLLIIALLLPWTRYWIFLPFRFLFRPPTKIKETPPTTE